MRRRMVGIGIALVALWMAGTPAFARQPGELSKKQQARLRALVDEASRKIDKAMGKSRERSKMQVGLERISKLRGDERRQAVEAYQKTFGVAYAAAAKRAGVDFRSLLKQAQRIAPEHQVELSGGFGLVIRIDVSGKPGGFRPAPRSVVTPIREFTRDREVTGGNGAGTVEFGDDRLKASSFAIAAGVASAEGVLETRLAVPAEGRRATVRARGTFTSEALAVGVAGSALTRTKMELRAQRGSEDRSIASRSMLVLAAILWVSYESDLTEFERTIPVALGESTRLVVRSTSLSAAILSPETHGSAEIDQLRLDLIVER